MVSNRSDDAASSAVEVRSMNTLVCCRGERSAAVVGSPSRGATCISSLVAPWAERAPAVEGAVVLAEELELRPASHESPGEGKPRAVSTETYIHVHVYSQRFQ